MCVLCVVCVCVCVVCIVCLCVLEGGRGWGWVRAWINVHLFVALLFLYPLSFKENHKLGLAIIRSFKRITYTPFLKSCGNDNSCLREALKNKVYACKPNFSLYVYCGVHAT